MLFNIGPYYPIAKMQTNLVVVVVVVLCFLGLFLLMNVVEYFSRNEIMGSRFCCSCPLPPWPCSLLVPEKDGVFDCVLSVVCNRDDTFIYKFSADVENVALNARRVQFYKIPGY